MQMGCVNYNLDRRSSPDFASIEKGSKTPKNMFKILLNQSKYLKLVILFLSSVPV